MYKRQLLHAPDFGNANCLDDSHKYKILDVFLFSAANGRHDVLLRDLARAKAVGPGFFVDGSCHGLFQRRVTGPAIARAIAREGSSLVDSVVVGVGSAGTITGVGETVKAWTNDVRIVAVEPYESQALSSGLTGSHGIPDIGFGLVPGNYNSYVVDNIAAVTTADSCLLYTSDAADEL